MVDWAFVRRQVETHEIQQLPTPARLRSLILAAIQSGIVLPGTRLKEIELGAAFEVSRTPLREALAALKAEQILEVDAEGLRVRTLGWHDITALYELRASLEVLAAGLAAQRANDVERQIIDNICREEEFLINANVNPVDLANHNKRFHHAILQAAGNQFLNEAIERLARMMVLTGATAYSVRERVITIRTEHIAINDAIQGQDKDRAHAAMQLHLTNALEARLTLLSRAGGIEVD